MIRRRLVSIWAVTATIAALPTGAIAQGAVHVERQSALAISLASQNPQERKAAVTEASRIAIADMTPGLRRALIQSLAQEGTNYHCRASNTACAVRDEGTNVLGDLMWLVGEMRDPDAIPALASVLGNGYGAVHPLVAFGDAAVPEVVRIVHPAQKRYEAVGAGLEVFRLMIEHPTVRLSQQNREIIRRIATDIIQTDGLYFTVYTKVINLASVLHDPVLDAQIRAIADDPNEMVRRGVTEPDLIEYVRQVARDRVAGVPVLPRPQ